MELAVRALIASVFAAVICILGFSMATAAIDTHHLSHTVTRSMADAEHLHAMQVVPIAQH